MHYKMSIRPNRVNKNAPGGAFLAPVCLIITILSNALMVQV